MQLTVLVDNNTFIDQYYLGEPGVSYYLEDGDTRVLFDVGYSDVFHTNAQRMGIDLSTVDTIVLSHGHNDHSGGLRVLQQKALLAGCPLVAHPLAFRPREEEGRAIGSPLDEAALSRHFRLRPQKEPLRISERLTFLGEVPTLFAFEQRRGIGVYQDALGGHADYVMDDSALVHKGKDGLFIITGCSHSGICSIIEHAKQVCHEERVVGVLGGFHLFDLSEQVERSIAYFQANAITRLYPCHCVSFAVKSAIHQRIPVSEVGVGLRLHL